MNPKEYYKEENSMPNLLKTKPDFKLIALCLGHLEGGGGVDYCDYSKCTLCTHPLNWEVYQKAFTFEFPILCDETLGVAEMKPED